MAQNSFTLIRDAQATLIPAGDRLSLKEGTEVFVTQALGGTVTVQAHGGLYRIESEDLDALGEEGQSTYAVEEKPREIAPGDFLEDQVWDALKTCFDPEIPVNIVDLGLIYDLKAESQDSGLQQVFVKMTLTAQGCGMGPTIAADAQQKIEGLPAVESAQVEIVWDPVWTPHMISDEGRKILGLN
ncbi:MAG: putative Fe-S cluster assembly protein SufT [Opitutaceae bacterium]|nr:putative Fe-S cluster assembly protein SufT [Opitutaceae bacterium]|tara:strand:- start:4145 stop:4699 length:555 start_codon:yes stop_codon:yes gene_type:complete